MYQLIQGNAFQQLHIHEHIGAITIEIVTVDHFINESGNQRTIDIDRSDILDGPRA